MGTVVQPAREDVARCVKSRSLLTHAFRCETEQISRPFGAFRQLLSGTSVSHGPPAECGVGLRKWAHERSQGHCALACRLLSLHAVGIESFGDASRTTALAERQPAGSVAGLCAHTEAVEEQ